MHGNRLRSALRAVRRHERTRFELGTGLYGYSPGLGLRCQSGGVGWTRGTSLRSSIQPQHCVVYPSRGFASAAEGGSWPGTTSKDVPRTYPEDVRYFLQRLRQLAASGQPHEWKSLDKLVKDEYGLDLLWNRQAERLATAIITEACDGLKDRSDDTALRIPPMEESKGIPNTRLNLERTVVKVQRQWLRTTPLATLEIPLNEPPVVNEIRASHSQVEYCELPATVLVDYIESCVLKTLSLFQIVGLKLRMPRLRGAPAPSTSQSKTDDDRSCDGKISGTNAPPSVAELSQVVTRHSQSWTEWVNSVASEITQERVHSSSLAEANDLAAPNSLYKHHIMAIARTLGIQYASADVDSLESGYALPEGHTALLSVFLPTAVISRNATLRWATIEEDSALGLDTKANSAAGVVFPFDRVFLTIDRMIQASADERVLVEKLKDSIIQTFAALAHIAGSEMKTDSGESVWESSTRLLDHIDERLLTEFGAVVLLSALQTAREVELSQLIPQSVDSKPKLFSPLSFARVLRDSKLLPENIPRKLSGTMELAPRNTEGFPSDLLNFSARLSSTTIDTETGPIKFAVLARYSQALSDYSWAMTLPRPRVAPKGASNSLLHVLPEKQSPLAVRYGQYRLAFSISMTLLLVHFGLFQAVSRLHRIMDELGSAGTDQHGWLQVREWLKVRSSLYHCLSSVNLEFMQVDDLGITTGRPDAGPGIDQECPDSQEDESVHLQQMREVAVGEGWVDGTMEEKPKTGLKRVLNKIRDLFAEEASSPSTYSQHPYLVLPASVDPETSSISDTSLNEQPAKKLPVDRLFEHLEEYLLLVDAGEHLIKTSRLPIFGGTFWQASHRLQRSWLHSQHLLPVPTRANSNGATEDLEYFDSLIQGEFHPDVLERIVIGSLQELASHNSKLVSNHVSATYWIMHTLRGPIAALYAATKTKSTSGSPSQLKVDPTHWLMHAPVGQRILKHLAGMTLFYPVESVRLSTNALLAALELGEKQRHGQVAPLAHYVRSLRPNSYLHRYSSLSACILGEQAHINGDAAISTSTPVTIHPGRYTGLSPAQLLALATRAASVSKVSQLAGQELFLRPTLDSGLLHSKLSELKELAKSRTCQVAVSSISDYLQALRPLLGSGVTADLYAAAILLAQRHDAPAIVALAIAFARALEVAKCDELAWKLESMAKPSPPESDDADEDLEDSSLDSEDAISNLEEDVTAGLEQLSELSDPRLFHPLIISLGFQRLLELNEVTLAWEAYNAIPNAIKSQPCMIRAALKAFSSAAARETNSAAKSKPTACDPSHESYLAVPLTAKQALVHILDALLPYLRRDDIAVAMIKAALAAGLVPEAQRVEYVWKEVFPTKSLPATAFHAWIRYYTLQDDVLGLSQTLHQMQHAGFLPAMDISLDEEAPGGEEQISILFSTERFMRLRKVGETTLRPRSVQESVPFGIMIGTLIRRGQLDQAAESFKHIARYDVLPDLTLTLHALRLYLHMKELHMARMALSYATKCLKLKAYDFGKIFNVALASLNSMNPNEAPSQTAPTSFAQAAELALSSLSILVMMRALSLRPTLQSYDPVLRLLLYRVRGVDLAQRLLQKCAIDQDGVVLDHPGRILRTAIVSAQRGKTNHTEAHPFEAQYMSALQSALDIFEDLDDSMPHRQSREFSIHPRQLTKAKAACNAIKAARDMARDIMKSSTEQEEAFSSSQLAWQLVDMYLDVLTETASMSTQTTVAIAPEVSMAQDLSQSSAGSIESIANPSTAVTAAAH